MPDVPFPVITDEEWKRALAMARQRRKDSANRLRAQLAAHQEKQKLVKPAATDQPPQLPGI